jgi:hypothetical protein
MRSWARIVLYFSARRKKKLSLSDPTLAIRVCFRVHQSFGVSIV